MVSESLAGSRPPTKKKPRRNDKVKSKIRKINCHELATGLRAILA
jgi:hypothetical protein